MKTGKQILKDYLQDIFKVAQTGDAREESYYSALSILFSSCAEQAGKRKTQITTLPKQTEAGNPDFRVWDGLQHIIGYIEAKNPTTTNLDSIDDSEQLKRYRDTFPNLILTNFFEFRFYRNGDLINSVQIGRPFIIYRLKTIPPVENAEKFFELLEQFFAFSLPRKYSAKLLAVELAKRTRFLKEQVVTEELKTQKEKGEGFLLGFYEAFQKHLIAGLSYDDFADLYSQTVTYGLFAARVKTSGSFNRRKAFDNIPHTIGILREIFRFISLEELPPQMEWIIDDISEVLNVADVGKILNRYFHEHKGRDPIVHFYETFLAEYNPKERERLGVYYTPEPVVSYITRSIHRVLKETFDMSDGLADTNVRLLDPAAGTLTFPAEAARIALEEFSQKYGEGAKKSLVKDHILKDYFAFEIMMAPYAIGHLKIGFLLEELGYRISEDERFQLYLTNTLEMKELAQSNLPGMSSLAHESRLAGKVKRETPILVILGNPPYSGHSSNVGKWISEEIKEYYQVDGKPLGERNPKWLQDDYVKFIRFAQWKIDRAGQGILGFITNHSYLDNPTFRGMRQSLMKSFDHIYLLNLHGNSLKKEKCPDGSKDENVFDIRTGVAIALFIKKPGLKKKISHADQWGLRKDKYAWLEKKDIRSTKWEKIQPKSEFYLFIPRDEALFDRYQSFSKITEIFPVNSVGIVTSRDNFVIDFDKESLKRRIRLFRDKGMPDKLIRKTFNLKDTSAWNMHLKRKEIIKDDDWEGKIIPVLYRPFDQRWIFYHDDVLERSRREVMQHVISGINIGLVSARSNKSNNMDQFLCSSLITEAKCGESTTQSYFFPLFLYPEVDKYDLFSRLEKDGQKKPNLTKDLLEKLSASYDRSPKPEEAFYYIYAVLYSPIYREKYADFLKIDFPRIPFSSDRVLFSKMAKLGKKLTELHLLKSPDLDKPICRFIGEGDNRVEKPKYEEKDKRVYINKNQYFDGVAPEAWGYYIGGYQVLNKWLKDRKKRLLFLEDIPHYCRVVTAISKTIRIQAEIEKLYPKVEKNIIDMNEI